MKKSPWRTVAPGGATRRTWCRRLGCAALFGLLVPALHALDPGKSVFQFNCQTWNRQVGLPAGKISAIVQGKDGYLWLGSQNGLIRFDGFEFVTFPINLPAARGQEVERLSLAPDGKLWFSIASGGYGNFDGRTFGAIDDARWNATNINGHAMLAASDGAIWTGSAAGWGRWVAGHPVDSFFEEGNLAAFRLWEDPTHRLWMGSNARGLYYWAGGEWREFPDRALDQLLLTSFAVDPAGDLWVGTPRGLYHYDAQFRRKEILLRETGIGALLVDSHGILWVGTDGSGLGRYQDKQLTMLRKADGLAGDSITALLEDFEGSLWVGTTAGLSQLTDLKFPLFSESEGLVSGVVVAIAPAHNGGLWVTTTHGASLFHDGPVRNYTNPQLLPDPTLRRVFEARNGDVYFVDAQKNLGVMAGEPPLAVYPSTDWPEAIAEDSRSVLVSMGAGIFRMEYGRLQPYRFEGSQPPFHWINHLTVAADDSIWASTNNGLFRVKDGKFRQWTTADGLPSGYVFSALVDKDGNVWAGTSLGLARVKDGHVVGFGPAASMARSHVYAMVPDDLGNLWLDSGRGLQRVALRSLNDFAEGRVARVESQLFDGVESVSFVDRTIQAANACKTPDGRLWFPTPHGVLEVDPAGYFINRVPPRVSLQAVQSAGRDLMAPGAAPLQPDDRNLDFVFAALSFIAPYKTTVRYRLEGYDPQWVTGDARRPASYDGLPPGAYTFHVQAANADGTWNLGGDSFSFVLPAPFYRRPWFYAVGAGGAAFGLFGLSRLVVWQLRRREGMLQARNARLEAKVAERTDELARSLSVLQATLDSTADGILSIQLAGMVISYNRQFAEMWRLPPERFGRLTDSELRTLNAAQVKDPEEFAARTARTLAEPEAETFEIVPLKDGRIFERSSKPQRIHDRTVGVVINYRDITARQRAEASLRESNDKFQQLADNISDVFWIRSPDMREVRYISPAVERIWGLAAADVYSHPEKWRESVHPEDRARVLAAFAALMDHAASIEEEYRIVRRDGGIRWVRVRGFQVRDAGHRLLSLAGIATDITAGRQADEEVRSKSALLQAQVTSAVDGILIVDPQGRKILQNERVADLLNIPPDIAADPDDRRQLEWVKGMVRNPGPFMERVTYLFSHPQEISRDEIELTDGKVLDRSSYPAVGADGKYYGRIWGFRDITERRRIEAQLLQSQKMETVGKLAGGIAHEFNSILTAIIGQSELLLGDLPAGGASSKKAAEISKAARRAATLTRQLLAYGRKQVLQLEVLDLNTIMAGMENTLDHLMGPETAVRIVPAPALRPVKVDAGQIEQVVMNLAMNAADAMPRGGKLTMETANVTFTEDSVGRDPELKPGVYVMLAVTDTGTGMAAEVKARLFEPFFSTKGVGKGTGLGLSTCYGIIKQSGGHISVYSEPGHGTAFKIYLPPAEIPAKDPAARLKAPGLPPGTETILFVEDDPALREMAVSLLRRLGYTVLPAANGIEALAWLQERASGTIDLVFTDLVMPHLSGTELAERVRATLPSTKILFTSAYPENALVQSGGLQDGVGLLPKPFTPAAMAQKLREVLDGAGGHIGTAGVMPGKL